MKALALLCAMLLASGALGCSALSKPDDIRVMKDPPPKPPEPEPIALPSPPRDGAESLSLPVGPPGGAAKKGG